jgi:hypothetical protein
MNYGAVKLNFGPEFRGEFAGTFQSDNRKLTTIFQSYQALCHLPER